MTGFELREIRRRFHMDRPTFARLIGYTGTERNNELRIKRLENAGDPVPLYIARLVWLIAIWARGHNQLPEFPDWPYYNFDHTPDSGHKEEA